MGTVTVIYGHAYDGKQQDALDACLNYIRRNAGDRCLYLVRSDVRVQQLRSQVLRELGGCFHFPIATLPDQIKRLYRQSLGARREISGLEQTLLIEEIFRQRAAEAGPRFCFQRFAEQHGIIEKVRDFLIMTRRYGIITPARLDERFQQCSPGRRVLYAELCRILSLYTTRLNDWHLIDETGIFLEMARRAESDELDLRSCVSSPELLVLEGYYELTPPEQQIFSALSRQFERAIMTIDTPLNPYAVQADTPKPFRIFRELHDYIRTSGFSVQEHHITGQTPRDAARQKIVAEIFETRTLRAEPASATAFAPRSAYDATDFFTVATYRHKAEEVTAIAREIKRLVLAQPDLALRASTLRDSTLRDIGVAFPVVEQYERLIAEIFPLFGIPFTMVQGRALAAAPVVVTILRMLDVVLQDYSREALNQLFLSPLAAFTRRTPENAPNGLPLTLDAGTLPWLDTLARALGIVTGKTVWLQKSTEYYASLQQQRRDLTSPVPTTALPEIGATSSHDDHDAAVPLAALDETLTRLAELLPTLAELFEEFSRFETDLPLPISDWIERLTHAIARLQIPPRVLQAPDRTIRESDAAALRAMLKVLETLRGQMAASRRCTLPEFAELLQRAVQPEIYYAPELLDDAVWILGHLDTRHVQFQYLFFGGLIERDFPGKTEPNIFLSEPETELFGLPTYTTRVQETDHLFYANLLNAAQHVYLSHPAQDGEKDLLKAVYLENILRWQREHGAPDGFAENDRSPAVSKLTPRPPLLESEGEQGGFAAPLLLPLSSQERGPGGEFFPQLYTTSDLVRWLGGTRVQADADPQCVRLVFDWLIAERGPQWAHSFVTGMQAHASRNAEELGNFDGVLASAWARRTLRRRYDGHCYAASEFDLYVRCPIRFFFDKIVHLTPLRETSPDMPRQEIDNLLHRIAYRFYAEAPDTQPSGREGNVDAAFLERKRDRAAWLQEAKTRLAHIVRVELEAYPYAGVFWEHLTAMLVDGLDTESPEAGTNGRQSGIFASFAEQEAAASDAMLPWFVQASFGIPRERLHTDAYLLSDTPLRLSGQDAQGRAVTVALRGQIDRIDVERATDAETRHVVVYDYVTGAMRPIKKIRTGASFRLPLAVLAAQEFLGKKYAVAAAGYYQLGSLEEVGKKAYFGSQEAARYLQGNPRGLLETQAEFRQVLDECKGHAIRAVEAIRSGGFHPAMSGPQEAGCDYCPYRQICRVDHQRMQAILKAQAHQEP